MIKKTKKKSLPLDGLLVLDFTSRLPGPLAGHLLREMGARVIKVETSSHPDPFKSIKLGTNDRAFQSWYKNMNKDKDSFVIDTQETKDRDREDENASHFQSLCKKAHMVLMGWPKKIQEKYEVTFENFMERNQWGAYIELTASHKHNRPMHDLNVLAEMGLLSLHIKQWERRSKTKRIAPPFLPIAGATFAGILSQRVLASALKGLKDQIWVHELVGLEEAIEETWNPLYAPDMKGVQDTFLHSGRYPCYNIYPLKNHRAHLAIACIEEKYWLEFIEAFNLELSSEDRFCDNQEDVFTAIQNCLAQYSVEEMQEKLQNLNCCLSLIVQE